MKSDLELYLADGASDSFLTYFDINYNLNAKLVISYSPNAVMNEECKEKGFDH